MTEPTETAITPEEFRERIERVYVAETGGSKRGRKEHGALAWFADRIRVYQSTVQRWVNGERTISGPAIALLEEIERRHDGDGSR